MREFWTANAAAHASDRNRKKPPILPGLHCPGNWEPFADFVRRRRPQPAVLGQSRDSLGTEASRWKAVTRSIHRAGRVCQPGPPSGRKLQGKLFGGKLFGGKSWGGLSRRKRPAPPGLGGGGQRLQGAFRRRQAQGMEHAVAACRFRRIQRPVRRRHQRGVVGHVRQ